MSRTVIILSVSSDIGGYLARQYLQAGCQVIGTYRTDQGIDDLKAHEQCLLFPLDLANRESFDQFIQSIQSANIKWDTFVSSVGNPLPLQSFFEANFDEWSQSVHVNSLGQLHALHALYPFRSEGKVNAVFFAGGGANNAVVNFSAYTISKIMLTKMCEFLDAENEDLNVFIVGPGWTKTKTHDLIMNDPHCSSQKLQETKEFMENKAGTPLSEIYDCIEWLCGEGKSVASGRNFSIVYDPWRKDTRQQLLNELLNEPDMYKLRRANNDFLQNKN